MSATEVALRVVLALSVGLTSSALGALRVRGVHGGQVSRFSTRVPLALYFDGEVAGVHKRRRLVLDMSTVILTLLAQYAFGVWTLLPFSLGALLVAAATDARTFKLPHYSILVATVGAIGFSAQSRPASVPWWEPIVGGLTLAVTLFVLAVAAGAFGVGDALLAVSVTVISATQIGWEMGALGAIFVAALIGAIVPPLVALVHRRPMRRKNPFGPALVAAALVMVTVGYAHVHCGLALLPKALQ